MSTVAVGLLMVSLDTSIVSLALPRIQNALASTFGAVQWILLAYSLVVVVTMLSVGRLADIYGRKRLYAAGFVLFTIGTGLCAVAHDLPLIIALRFLQGSGAVFILALNSAILTQAFPAEERGKAMGVSAFFISLGQIIGPLLGGVLLIHFGWPSIFLVNVPPGIAGVVLALVILPRDIPGNREPFDWWGAFCLLVALLGTLLGLTFGQRLGFGTPLVLGAFAIAVVMFAAFIYLERKVRFPMLDLQLLRNRSLVAALSGTFLSYISFAGAIILLPYYLQTIRSIGSAQAGLLMMVMPIAMAASSPLAGTLSDRFGEHVLTTLGLVLMTLGFSITSLLNTSSSWYLFSLCTALIGVGMGTFQSPNNAYIMGCCPKSRLGITSSMLAEVRNLGQTFGIALLGTIWIARIAALRAVTPSHELVTYQVRSLSSVMILAALVLLLALAVTLLDWFAGRVHPSDRVLRGR
ncbi:MAG: MFS transporter [Anaerolineae bacterium]